MTGREPAPIRDFWGKTSLDAVISIEVIHLATNLGHQPRRSPSVWLPRRIWSRSIASSSWISDGEDRPQDLIRILDFHEEGQDDLVVVRRGKRTERLLFKIGYVCYKVLFWLLTGKKIGFGNFCLNSKKAHPST